ncbi:MAG: biopolymer transporter ExbD [Pseudomonadota bacterium]
MEFRSDIKRTPSEPFVPMINVVFLLLIFFLMTAQIAPPPPFETEPPVARDGGDPTGTATLHLSPEGAFGFAEIRGEAALAAALTAAGGDPLRLTADGGMEAAKLAAALAQLSAAGIDAVELTTMPRRDP